MLDNNGNLHAAQGSVSPRDHDNEALVPARCVKHPGYKAKGRPRPSKRYPDGCGTCWTIYNLRSALRDGYARRIF